MRLRSSRWIVAGVLAAITAQARAEPEPTSAPGVRPTESAEERRSAGPRLHLAAHVSQTYSSNLFHEQSRRLSLFEAGADRYEGMQGPSDFVTEPGLDAGMTWKLGKRRRLSFELGAQYAVHARNAIADYLSLGGEVRYKLGKRDSLVYEARLVPERFVKNYAYDGVPALSQTYYQRADRLELGNELSYRHVWSKRLRSAVRIALNMKRFDAPFENRDANEHELTLASAYAPWRAIEIELGLGFGLTRTPRGLEYRKIEDARAFIPVDRSHHDVEPQLHVVLDLPARFEVVLGFGARLRQFETAERQDDTYYGRHDVRFELEAELRKGFGRRFDVALQAGYQDSNAYRVDPGDDADDYGFEELTLALELQFRLD